MKNWRGVAETEIAYKNDIKSLSDQINEKTDKIKEITKIISQFSANKKVIEAHISSLEQTIMEAKVEEVVVAEGKGQFDEKERMNALISTVNSLGIDLKTFEENYQNSLKEKDELDNEINELRKKINNINIEINNHLEQERNIKFNLNQLKRIRDSKTNLFKGTKTILDNKNNFRGVKGIVADLIKTSQEYLPALETILKGAAQHIVVDHSDTAVKAINFLKSNDGGRATFIPLSTIKSKFVRDDYLLVIRNNPGFVGIASELVTVAEEYRVLNEFLLGNVIVVSDIKTANEISTIMDKKYMVVTLDGDIIRVGGIMVGVLKKLPKIF
ncbi:hypothetical protein NWP96_06205 [Mycoplasmopsis cynos]|nr:hypothetical protein [Mycoplasmopsis cynos]